MSSRHRALCSTPLLFVVLLSGCNALRLQDIGTYPDQIVWTTEGGTNARSFAVGDGPQAPFELDWRYSAAAAFGPAGPLLLGRYVLVATRKGDIQAIDAARGKKAGVKGFGDVVNGSPAVDRGIVYVPVAWGRNTGVAAYELRSGAQLWRFESAPVSNGILVVGGTVIFSDDDSIVYALTSQGNLEWSLLLDDRFGVTTTPILALGGTVVFANDAGHVYGLSLESGEVLWTRALGEPVYSSMSSKSGVLYVPTTRASLYAIDARTGADVWQHRAPDPRIKFATPAVSAEGVLVGGSDGSLTCLNVGDGAVQWMWSGEGAITAAPVIAGNAVFFGAMDATAHVLDLKTGVEVWSTSLEGRVKSAAAVDRDAFYLLGEPRYVYRFVSRELDAKEPGRHD